ncbi:MAG: phage baseplate assembly protein V [Candidatus Azobacteroides sp.]|nr:phage baseplate assembly protein V [Candidatus Azobacteroides sp.]
MATVRTPEIKAVVSVAGTIMPFVSLKIAQEMGAHHDFELLLDHKTFDAAFFNSPEKQLNLIYTKVIVDLSQDGGVPYVFAGMVTNVRMQAREGDHGGVLLTGKSYTIELERGNMMQTYSNTDLTNILREVTSGTAYLSSLIIPEWKADIDFSIQYDEDDWHYLQRLYNQYNEPYFYSGLELIIGNPPEKPVTKLTYDKELRSFEICSRLVPNQFTNYYYKRDEHNLLIQDSPGQIEGATSNLQLISGKSDWLTRSRKPNVPVEAYVPDMSSLTDQVKRRKVAAGGQMYYVKGEAKTCDILIGRRISINMPKTAGGTDMGTFRVFKTVHYIDEAGRYVCNFEAVPADLKYIPTPKVSIPTPNPIECEVYGNEDPQGLGRVKVKFPFDERVCSAWIPVSTPDAGGNGLGLGPANRGFSFVPEQGDSVLVEFLSPQQLSQPYVSGSMYHGGNAVNLGGGAKGNNIKTIITRSKAMIKFDDTEGGESITVIDKNQNTVFIDTAQNNITVTANNNMTLNATETMTLNCKNLRMNVTDDMATDVGKNQETYIGKNRTVDCLNNTEVIQQRSKIEIGLDMEQSSATLKMVTTQGDMIMKGSGNTLVQGRLDARISKG